MNRHRIGQFWRRPAPTRRHEVAAGVLACPTCGTESRVLVFEAQTKRTAQSPDLIAYANNSETDSMRATPTETGASDGGAKQGKDPHMASPVDRQTALVAMSVVVSVPRTFLEAAR